MARALTSAGTSTGPGRSNTSHRASPRLKTASPVALGKVKSSMAPFWAGAACAVIATGAGGCAGFGSRRFLGDDHRRRNFDGGRRWSAPSLNPRWAVPIAKPAPIGARRRRFGRRRRCGDRCRLAAGTRAGQRIGGRLLAAAGSAATAGGGAAAPPSTRSTTTVLPLRKALRPTLGSKPHFQREIALGRRHRRDTAEARRQAVPRHRDGRAWRSSGSPCRLPAAG